MSVYTLALIGSGPLNSLLAGVLGNELGAAGAIATSGAALGLAVALVAVRNRPVVELQVGGERSDLGVAG